MLLGMPWASTNDVGIHGMRSNSDRPIAFRCENSSLTARFRQSRIELDLSVQSAKQLLVAIIFLAFASLNLRGSEDLWTGSKGFPFAFLTWTHEMYSMRIHVWPLTADAAIGLGLL